MAVEWHGHGRLPDVDNIGGRTKAYLDGLTDAKVWHDDSAVASIMFEVHRVRKPAQPGVVIHVSEIPG